MPFCKMKTISTIAAVILAAVFVSPPLCAEKEDRVDHTVRMVEMVVEMIGDAQTVVICDFELPEGTKVTEVLIGDFRRLGQLWNSKIFPKKPILAYERVNDHLGSGSSTLIETSHFELDQSKRFVIMESVVDGEAEPKSILIPLDVIKHELAKRKKQNKAQMATPRKPSD